MVVGCERRHHLCSRRPRHTEYVDQEHYRGLMVHRIEQEHQRHHKRLEHDDDLELEPWLLDRRHSLYLRRIRPDYRGLEPQLVHQWRCLCHHQSGQQHLHHSAQQRLVHQLFLGRQRAEVSGCELRDGHHLQQPRQVERQSSLHHQRVWSEHQWSGDCRQRHHEHHVAAGHIRAYGRDVLERRQDLVRRPWLLLSVVRVEGRVNSGFRGFDLRKRASHRRLHGRCALDDVAQYELSAVGPVSEPGDPSAHFEQDDAARKGK